MVDIFEHNSYKAILKKTLLEKKEKVSRSFTYEKMAKACRIQKTYLSRVLNSQEAHLNDNQLYQACLYLGLNNEERGYLQLLLRYERAYIDGLKNELGQEIEAIQKAHRKTDQHIQVNPTQTLTSDFNNYYLDPMVMLVHVFMTIDSYRRDLPLLSRTLKIAEDRLGQILASLETSGLVRLTESGYEVLTNKTHLSVDSPLYKTFRSMQRLKAMEQLSHLENEKAYSFSVAFSTNPDIRAQIHKRILALIGEIEGLVSDSAEEEVYQLNIDLFDWC